MIHSVMQETTDGMHFPIVFVYYKMRIIGQSGFDLSETVSSRLSAKRVGCLFIHLNYLNFINRTGKTR